MIHRPDFKNVTSPISVDLTTLAGAARLRPPGERYGSVLRSAARFAPAIRGL
jgi:hypothetical protein